jgi:hypothetical protein
VELLVKGKANPLVLVPKWHKSEFNELSYWIPFVAKLLKYDSGSEFYELSYWIQVSSQVLKYPTGYYNVQSGF